MEIGKFNLIKTEGRARRGEFCTAHGVVQTPVFQKARILQTSPIFQSFYTLSLSNYLIQIFTHWRRIVLFLNLNHNGSILICFF